MIRPITTADVLPFDWGDYTYTAKQGLPIDVVDAVARLTGSGKIDTYTNHRGKLYCITQ